ncbi:MAG: uridine kinase [Peptoniphilaceae bacterium]|nr:uridine kinase [Peptoniphilaceae bacterium]MDD7433931.1 uridine kinase [Peptoniphilaceae bacterium]
MPMKTVIIGIAGGSGSGKSTFTNRLKDYFQDQLTVIYHDNYYKSNEGVPFEERKKRNYDHPDAFDTDLLVSHLSALKEGKTIESPVYDFTMHTRSDEVQVLKPSRVMIVEGILILQAPALRRLLDIKLFVDADADERILRRILRDVQERGRKVDDIIDQYLNTVKPMHELFVEPTRGLADLVLNSGKNDIAFDIIKTEIECLLQMEEKTCC